MNTHHFFYKNTKVLTQIYDILNSTIVAYRTHEKVVSRCKFFGFPQMGTELHSGSSLTSWGEGASLALVGHPSSNGFKIKIPYGVDVLLH